MRNLVSSERAVEHIGNVVIQTGEHSAVVEK